MDNNKELRIQWPFAPDHVSLNNDTVFLKILAMLLMLCDHAGKILFPQWRIMRIIGRLAFPIFAYTTAVGCVYTHDALKYLKRMTALALITQPIYAVALRHTVSAMYEYSFTEQPIRACIQFYLKSWVGQPSILLTLIAGILMVRCLRNRHFSLLIGIGIIVWYSRGILDYGWQGVALIMLFYIFCDKPVLSLPCVLAFMLWWGISGGSSYHLFGVSFSMETFAVLALPFIYIRTHSHLFTKLKLPNWAFYAYYPGHMVLIWLVKTFVMK